MTHFTINNGAVLRLVLIGAWDTSVQIRNVFQYRLEIGGPLNETQVVDDFGEIAKDLVDLFAVLQDERMLWSSYSVATLDEAFSSGEVGLPGGNVAGEESTGSAPTSIAALISFATGFKRTILKKFVGPLSKTFIGADGNLASGGFAPMNAIGGFMRSSYEATNGQYIYGYASIPGVGASWKVPSSHIVRHVLSPMRRRKIGVGV